MIKLYLSIISTFLCCLLNAQVTSVSSGNWNSSNTWSTGTVPALNDQVVIANGHVVEVSSVSYAGNITVHSGGTLHIDTATLQVTNSINNSGTLTTSMGAINIGGAAGTGLTNSGTMYFSGGSINIGPDGGSNRTVLNNGTMTIYWADVRINGNLKSTAGSIFNFENGNIKVDGNSAGDVTNSVANGTHLVEFSNSTAAALNLNGGIMRIVDPHASASATTYTMYVNIPQALQLEAASNFWFHLGDNISTDASGSVNGFSLNLHAGAANLALANVVLNGPSNVNRHLSSVHPLIITRDVIVHPNMDFRPGVDVYLGRDMNVMGTATLEHKVSFTHYNLLTGVSTQVPFQQNIGGQFRNSLTSPTANFNKLYINSNRLSLLSPYAVADTLWLNSGTVAASTLTLGTSPTQTGTLIHGTGTVEGDLRRFVATSTGSYLYPIHGNKITVDLTTAPATGGEITVGLIHEARKLTLGLPLFEGSMLIDTAAASNGPYPGVFKVNPGTGLTGGTYNIIYEWKPFNVNTDPSKLVLMYRQNDSQPWNLQGTHVATSGTYTAPTLRRNGLSVYGQFGIGKSTISIGANTVMSVNSGNWNTASTWNIGTVPINASQVIIREGDSVVISGTAQANEIIIAGSGIVNVATGSLSVAKLLNGGSFYHTGGSTVISGAATKGYSSTNSGKFNLSSGQFKLGPDNGGNRTFLNTGAVDITGGLLEINGNLSNQPFSSFTQTAGTISVDGNAGGNTANSVAEGTPIVLFEHYLSFPSGLNFSGGMFTIVDPHASATATSALDANVGEHVLSTGMHTFRFGNGMSTDAGGNGVGFRINDSYRINETLKLNNVIIEGSPGGANRHVTPNFNMHITGNLLLNFGGEYRVGTIGTSSTYPYTKVGGNFNINTGSIATIPGSLIMGGNTHSQAINNDGILQNSFTNPTANLQKLIIDKPWGTVSIGSPLSVSQTLELHGASTIDMGIHTLTLGTSPTQTGSIPVASGRIAGKFRRYIAASTGTYNFPTGSIERSRSVAINYTIAPSAGGTLTTEWISSYAGTNGLPLTEGSLVVDSTSRSGYWNITPGTGLNLGTYTGTFSPDDIAGFTDISKLVLLQRNNPASPWTLHGTHVTTSGSVVVPILRRTGMTAYGDLGIGISSGNTVLPVTLVSFEGGLNTDATVDLQWQVLQQHGIDRYVIERSNNGREFTVIGKVSANSLAAYNYKFTDALPLTGRNYYRLKIEEQGRHRYSTVIVLILNNKSTLTVYPVPAKDAITVERSHNDRTEAVITDVQGKIVMRVLLMQNRQQVNISTLLPGTYILKAGDETITIIK